MVRGDFTHTVLLESTSVPLAKKRSVPLMAKVTPLSSTRVKQEKPDKTKVKKLPDGDGLYLIIKPSGTKIWHFRYVKPIINKQTTLSFGAYPETTLAQARIQRDEARALIANGIDPKNHKEETNREKLIKLNNSFQSVFNDWFQVKEAQVTLKQAQLIKRSFENHLFND